MAYKYAGTLLKADTARKKLESKKLGQALAKAASKFKRKPSNKELGEKYSTYEQVKVKPKIPSFVKSGMWRLGGEDLKEGR